jgi:SagB-type dehydrogenase family enzyme
MVYTYHNETKHSQQRYAKSLGYMDWNTQPNPFRTYQNTTKTALPLAFEHDTLPYKDIFEQPKQKSSTASLNLESISQFFQFSMGLAAIKEFQGQSWALRCNASSGNLHPTESYIIVHDIQSIPNGLHHYAPQEHELELLSSAQKDFALPKNSFLVCLSSIVWREAWKYGERAWRYTQLDCGHALKALEVSAFMLGWKVQLFNVPDTSLQRLMGFDQKNRFIQEETEFADLLMMVTPDANDCSLTSFDVDTLQQSLQQKYEGQANQLSKAWHHWDILQKIEDATRHESNDETAYFEHTFLKNSHRRINTSAKEIILNRRSVQKMNPKDAFISKKAFETILGSIRSEKSNIHLVIFVHNIEALDSGLYILIRNPKHKAILQELLKDDFLWQRVNTQEGELYCLQHGDFKFISKAISCNQDIASEGAFSLGMLAQFMHPIQNNGTSVYKHLYWECGAIGQQLYLESTSLNLSATGIGCFLDDMMHDTIGLQSNHFQSLYHFTVGRGLTDNRLTTRKPYKQR